MPVVWNGAVYVCRADGVVLALDARTGAERWRESVGAAAYAPRAMDGRVYVPTQGTVVALTASDGTEDWRVDTPERADVVDETGTVERPTVLVADHGVYWISHRGQTDDGAPAVVALAPDDGAETWRTEIDDPWTRWLFAGSDSVFVSTSHEWRVPWRLEAGPGDVLGNPAEPGADFTDERFYRDGTVYAVDEMFGGLDATGVDDGGHD